MYELYCRLRLSYNSRHRLHDPDSDGNAIVYDTRLSRALNTSGSLDFTIAPNHPHYDKIKPLESFVELVDGERTVWIGKVFSVETSFSMEKTARCVGIMSLLADVIVKPKDYENVEVKTFLKEMLTLYNSKASAGLQITLEEDKEKSTGFFYFDGTTKKHVNGKTSYQTILQAISELVIVPYGGYITIDYTPTGMKMIYSLHPYPNTKLGQELEYGKNIINLSVEDDRSDICTRVIALGKETDNPDGTTSQLIYEKEYMGSAFYGVIEKVIENEDATTQELLESWADSMLANLVAEPTVITVNAIDLNDLKESWDPIEIGHRIKVTSENHGIDKTLPVAAVSMDITDPSTAQYTLGINRLASSTTLQ